MKTIKVFVSSPGDVQAERTIADRIIRVIAEELGIPISVQYSNLLRESAPTKATGLSDSIEVADLSAVLSDVALAESEALAKVEVSPAFPAASPDSDEIILCPYFWEYQRFSPELGYNLRILVSILWSRATRALERESVLKKSAV